MPLDPISGWIVSFAWSKTEAALFSALFRDDLLRRIRRVAEAWRGALPAGCEFLKIEALFVTHVSVGGDLPPRPDGLLSSMQSGRIPSAVDWEESFVKQWKFVRINVSEPQPFFTLDESDARVHLGVLSVQVHAECAKDAELYQQASYQIQSKLLSGQEETNERLEKLEETIQEVLGTGGRSPVSGGQTAVADGSDSSFHAEIEVACRYREENRPDLAIAKFDDLIARHWDALTAREKYRVLANRGLAYQDKDDFELAAKDFIDCRQHQPTDEKARSFEASGHFMLGNSAECYRLAQGILADFKDSKLAYALLVRSAPEETSFEEIESVVPPEHRDDGDVALAFSIRALDGRLFEPAENYARQFLKAGPGVAMAKSHLGGVLVNSTITRIAPLLSDSPPVDVPRLEEAIALLEDAKTIFVTQGASESEARCHFHLGRAYDFLGRDEDAEHEFRAACDKNPKEVCFSIQLAMMLHEKQPERAIGLLTNVAAHDESLSASTMLGQMIRRLNGDEHVQEAIKPLEDARPQFPGPSSTANSEYLDTLASFYQLQQRHEDAEQLIEAESQKLGKVERLTLQSAVQRRKGDQKTSRKTLRRAVKAISADTENWHKHLVVRELMQHKMDEEAFGLLTSYVPSNCMSIDTGTLVACAQRSNKDDFLIGFLGSLRTAGVLEPTFVDIELGLLERYHAGDQCVVTIEHLLASNAGDDEFRRELLVRLSYLGMAYDRLDLIETDLDKLPHAATAAPYVGFLVVQLLIQNERHDDARRYAYTLVRANVDSEWAHKSMIGAYLFDPNKEPYIRPSQIQIGTAFHFQEDDTGVQKWAILEDDPKPDAARDEYPPDHHVFANAIGKKIGEKFFLRRAPIQAKTATILAIDDKKVFRFNQCLREWETRFDEFFIVSMTMPKNENGELDITPIIDMAKEHAAEVEKGNDVYRSQPFPTSAYAVRTQRDIVDVMLHLASCELPIRCCAGNNDEHAMALRALDNINGVVLDHITVATLLLTKSYKYLDGLTKAGLKLYIPRGVLLRLLSRIDSQVRFSGNGSVAYHESHIILTEESPDERDSKVRELEDLLKTLKRHCTVVDGLPLSRFTPKLRGQLRQIFGWETAEAMAIANERHLALWTDDFFVGQFAFNEHKTPRVWTEAVWQWAETKGVISRKDYLKIGSHLVQLRFDHTRLRPDMAIMMGQESDWDFRREPFASAIRWLENPAVLPAGIGAVAEQLLPMIYHGQNDFINSVTVQDILTSIAKRPDGRAIIKELRRRVGIICGYDFITADRLTQDIEMWQRHDKGLS